MTGRTYARVIRRVGLIAGLGLGCALVAALLGTAWVRNQLGVSAEETAARVEAVIRARLDASTQQLAAISRRVANERELIREGARETAIAPRLFDALSAAVPRTLTSTTGVTVYDAAGTPIGWVGRVFEFPTDASDDSGGVFVQADPFGPRLVRIEALGERDTSGRAAVIVAEQRLGEVRPVPGQPAAFVLPTELTPVTVAVRDAPLPGDGAEPVRTFVIRSEAGRTLLSGAVARQDVEALRAAWHRSIRAVLAAILALTVLGIGAAVLEFRRRARGVATVLVTSAISIGLFGAAWRLLHFAGELLADQGWPHEPIERLLTAVALLGLAWLLLDLVERWRISGRRRIGRDRSTALTVAAFAAAGAATALLIGAYSDFLRGLTSSAPFDLLHFSLHPLDFTRLISAFALVVLHAAAVWSAAAVTRAVGVARRHPRSRTRVWSEVLAWSVAAAMTAVAVTRWDTTLPIGGLLFPTAAAGIAALGVARPRGAIRRGSQAGRLGLLYLALAVPALSAYPLLDGFAREAKERLIADEFGPAAASQRDDLKQHLARALAQIDNRATHARLPNASPSAPPDAQAAFEIWRSTDLDTYRLTSAIELYGADGRLVSRFALRLPQTAPATYRVASCDWDLLDEVSPIGASDRHVLRASRALCERGRRLGTIVVRVMLDYRTLPFIRTESPYMASLGPGRDLTVEGAPGRDVQFVGYGWSRAPLMTSGVVVWPLSERVFARLVDTRTPFWERIELPDASYRVYFLSDRGGIYALGYPVIPLLGHLVNLAELVVLVMVVYLGLLVGATVTSALITGGLSGRELFREVRSSFYRKLVAAFVLSAAVPVFVLALFTSAYFSAQARAGVEAEAIKTVTVAQRLVEDYVQLDATKTRTFQSLDDQTMVIVGRAIDQPVNLFEHHRLWATSERDLFASALLSPRTASAVYRGIVLERRPAFVGEEEVNGSPYLVAAAPVRAGDRQGIVTVPQTLRQREIEAQIDELNRRIVSAAVLFVLLGAAVGYRTAERIADPVKRLNRATRRIARGDLDARIAATSSDELRRLVEDFNHMAADLKRQRAELERTQRLEAWADMARQVAHDIKNPLTPIQLSAEHAQRVNQDRGRPLSPVLDECVSVILGQVRLLRQISAEFSSFASSPTARPEATELNGLIEEVIGPYRTTLAARVNRIDVVTTSTPTLPTLVIDRTLFARALTNIIENAVHAMPSGGRLTVAATVEGVPPAVTVRVTDTGIGMDADAVARIFEPYFSTRAAGTGLGLTIAKRNVELNGGQIAVTSQRGVGTTVTLILPMPA